MSSMTDYLTCPTCNLELPIQKFRYSKVSKNFSSVCTVCESKASKQERIEAIQNKDDQKRDTEWEYYYGIHGVAGVYDAED